MATNQFVRSHSGYGSLDIVAGLCAAPCLSPTREYGNWPLLSELGGMGPGSPASSATYSTPSPPATASPWTPGSPYVTQTPRIIPSGSVQSHLLPQSPDASTAQSPVQRQYGRARAPTGSSLIPMLDYPRALASSPVLSRSRPTHASRTSMSISTKRGSYQLVPQRAYSTHFGVSNGKVIPFQLIGANGPGVPMRMLINEDAVDAPIVGPHDLPFDETVPSTITLRIWWPGYEVYPRRLTMRKASGLLNRIELAMCLTECFRNFIEEARSSRTASEPEARWRVGQGGLSIRDLVLVGLRQVSQGSYQAEVALV